MIVIWPSPMWSAITYFDEPGYRSFSDSPFIDLEEFYLEDFEDGLLNTPNVIAADGIVLTVGTVGDVRSVDADDGTIDGVSSGFGSLGSTRPLAPFHSFEFTPDGAGRYPTFVGVVVTMEFDLSRARDTFGALSGTGGNLPMGSHAFYVDDLVAVTDEIGNVEHSRFIGLFWSEGISRFGVTFAAQLDHLQYSYAIPEPNTVSVMVITVVSLLLRRRRRS